MDQILSKGKYTRNQQGLSFKGERSNSKTIYVKSNSISFIVISPILENKKLAASFVATENFTGSVMIEQKSEMSLVNCRFGVSSNMGNGVSVATKGKLATT